MSLNTSVLASRIATAGVTAAQALTIANEVVSLIGVVEQVYEGLKGDVKFKAVMAGLDQVIDQMGLTDKLQAIRNKVGPLVNLVVAVLNASNLWATVFGAISSFVSSLAPKPAPVQASASATMSAGGAAVPTSGQ